MERRTPPARDTSSMMTSNESRSECKFISYTLCTFGDAAINKDRLLHTRDICIDRIALHAGNPRRDMMVNIVGKYDVSGLHTINIFVYTFNDRHCLAALCYYCYHLQPFFIYLLNIPVCQEAFLCLLALFLYKALCLCVHIPMLFFGKSG